MLHDADPPGHIRRISVRQRLSSDTGCFFFFFSLFPFLLLFSLFPFFFFCFFSFFFFFFFLFIFLFSLFFFFFFFFLPFPFSFFSFFFFFFFSFPFFSFFFLFFFFFFFFLFFFFFFFFFFFSILVFFSFFFFFFSSFVFFFFFFFFFLFFCFFFFFSFVSIVRNRMLRAHRIESGRKAPPSASARLARTGLDPVETVPLLFPAIPCNRVSSISDLRETDILLCAERCSAHKNHPLPERSGANFVRQRGERAQSASGGRRHAVPGMPGTSRCSTSESSVALPRINHRRARPVKPGAPSASIACKALLMPLLCRRVGCP